MQVKLVRYGRDPKTGIILPPGSELDLSAAEVTKWEDAGLIERIKNSKKERPGSLEKAPVDE